MLSPQYLAALFPGGIPASAVDVSPEATVAAILGANQPEYTRESRALDEAAAASGVPMGGGLVGAQQQLGVEQGLRSLGQLAPVMQQAQAMGLGQQEFNIDNVIRAAMGDTAAYNQMALAQAGFTNEDWLAQLNAAQQLALGQAGATSGVSQPVYQQPAPVNLGGIGAAAAPRYTNTYQPGYTPPAPYSPGVPYTGAGAPYGEAPLAPGAPAGP